MGWGKKETSLFPVVNVLFNYSNNNRHHRSNNNHHNHHNDKNNNNNGSARSHVPCRAVSYASAIAFLRGSTWSCTCEFDLPYIPFFSQQRYFLEAYNKPTSYSIKCNLARWFRFLIHAPLWLFVCLYVTVDVPRVYVCVSVFVYMCQRYTSFDCKKGWSTRRAWTSSCVCTNSKLQL